MFDKFREECGVFGIFGHPEAANLTYLGLYALQHRGQESAGIAASDGARIRVSQGDGLRQRRLRQRRRWRRCPGTIAVGHVRYSTAGESRLANAQPIVIDSAHGQLAVVPQRQPRQRRRAARRARARGRDLPDHQRHRGGRAPVRALAATTAPRRRSSRRCRRCAAPSRSCMMTEGPADRRPRSARVPAAGARAGSATPG